MTSGLRVVTCLVLIMSLSGCLYHLSGRSWTTDSVIAAAEDGDPVAQRTLGDMYYWGEDVPQDWALAFAYWELAAEQGEPLAIERVEDFRTGEPVLAVSDGGDGRRTFGSTVESIYGDETL